MFWTENVKSWGPPMRTATGCQTSCWLGQQISSKNNDLDYNWSNHGVSPMRTASVEYISARTPNIIKYYQKMMFWIENAQIMESPMRAATGCQTSCQPGHQISLKNNVLNHNCSNHEVPNNSRPTSCHRAGPQDSKHRVIEFWSSAAERAACKCAAAGLCPASNGVPDHS